MAKPKTVKLKLSEVEHLLGVIEERESDGWWFGKKAKFEEREKAIKRKLLAVTRANRGEHERS